ncbi:MAG: MGH1-like glycoside hydrolase domain-containing protein [Candidatus Saccharimonadales bacterium]
MEPPTNLVAEAYAVLDANDCSAYTQPAANLYPHQWLWDSCFIAIGLRHRDPERAQNELLSLLRGQWQNGMLPNIIFSQDDRYERDRNFWRSWTNPNAPSEVATTGITQPPMLAEAVVRVGEKLSPSERRAWYRKVYPSLLKYHLWLYAERDPHKEGLVLQIHPWEVGMDNTPPWVSELREHQLSLWIRGIKRSHADKAIGLFRRDTRGIPSNQRFDTIEALALFDAQRRLRRKIYDIRRILDHSMFAIEDVAFNAILIRNNNHLKTIASTISEKLPNELIANQKKTEQAFEQLWDPFSTSYFSRDFITHKLLKEPSIGSLLALYAGSIPEDNASILVKQLGDKLSYGSRYPIPSVPLNSRWFKASNYWQGPTWVNTNWLIIDGLKRYGFINEAKQLREITLNMVTNYGFSEYFDPNDGRALGTPGFSWTAALAVDLCLTPISG